jgi:hypothetical protein
MVNRIWTLSNTPIKFTEPLKEELSKRINELVKKTQKLARVSSRIHLQGGRIYFYYLSEVHLPENGHYMGKPLIDGKYQEWIFARITVYDKNADHCTADWQNSSLRWYVLHEGSLENCIQYIETNQWGFAPPHDRFAAIHDLLKEKGDYPP